MIFSILFGSSWLVTAEHEDGEFVILEIRDHNTNESLDLEGCLNELEYAEQTHLLTGSLETECRKRMEAGEGSTVANCNV